MVRYLGILLAVLLLPLLATAQTIGITLGVASTIDVDTTVEQLPASSAPISGVVLQCVCPGEHIYFGGDNTTSASTGIKLSDGQTVTLEVDNTNAVWVIASANNQDLRVLPYTRR